MTLEWLENWNQDKRLANADSRSRLVHGVAFGAFIALAQMLNIQTFDIPGYMKNLTAHCVAQVEEVKRQVTVEKFFRDMVTALESDAFGITTPDRRRLFMVLPNKGQFAGHLPVASPAEQLAKIAEDDSAHKVWKSQFLFFQPDPVIDMINEYLRRIGDQTRYDRSDLQAQMSTRPYWVKSPKRSIHKQRFAGVTGNKTCWCVDLDRHPEGRQEVTPEEWQESLFSDETGTLGIAREDWVDPRKGNLFAIVDSLVRPVASKSTEEEA